MIFELLPEAQGSQHPTNQRPGKGCGRPNQHAAPEGQLGKGVCLGWGPLRSHATQPGGRPAEHRGRGDVPAINTRLTRAPFLFGAGATSASAENEGFGLRGPRGLSCPARGSGGLCGEQAWRLARLHVQEREAWKLPSPCPRAALRRHVRSLEKAGRTQRG